MKEFNLVAKERELLGTNNSGRLRRLQGMIPAVVYGGGKANQDICLEEKELKKAMQHEAFYSQILNLSLDGKEQKIIVKEVQRTPVKSKLVHLDFQRIDVNSVIRMQVPLHFENESSSVAIKTGGTITKNLIQIELKCKAKDLPEYIAVDLKDLKLGQTIHLTDLNLPKGVELAAHGKYLEQAVVSASVPKEEKEEVAAEEAEVAPAPVKTTKK